MDLLRRVSFAIQHSMAPMCPGSLRSTGLEAAKSRCLYGLDTLQIGNTDHFMTSDLIYCKINAVVFSLIGDTLLGRYLFYILYLLISYKNPKIYVVKRDDIFNYLSFWERFQECNEANAHITAFLQLPIDGQRADGPL